MDFQSVGANLFRRTGSPSYPKNKLSQTTSDFLPAKKEGAHGAFEGTGYPDGLRFGLPQGYPDGLRLGLVWKTPTRNPHFASKH
jgi:hypothetical protein